jgi:hypothetical protein
VQLLFGALSFTGPSAFSFDGNACHAHSVVCCAPLHAHRSRLG